MRILIVDDHPLFRAGLKALLYELDSNIETTQAPTLGKTCDLSAKGEIFDLILLDLNLPDGKGLDVLERVKEVFDTALIAIMSASEDPHLIRAVIDAGACGYIPKTTDPLVTVNALRLILVHGIYLPLNVLQSSEETGPYLMKKEKLPEPCLSERQLAVLHRLLQGKPNKIIARELAIAEGTVKAHLASIYQFLNVATRSQAMYRAHQLGLFDKFASLPQNSSASE